MKYALSVSMNLACATIYFDRSIRHPKDNLNLDIGHLDNPGLPELFKSILNLPGVFGIVIRDQAIMVELLSSETHFEPRSSWVIIGRRIARLIAWEHNEFIERVSANELFPEFCQPNSSGQYI